VRAHPTNYFLKETAITVPETAIAIRIDVLEAFCLKKQSGTLFLVLHVGKRCQDSIRLDRFSDNDRPCLYE